MKKLFILLILASQTFAYAKGTYQEPVDFISENFNGMPPPAKVIWLSKELKIQIEKILSHKYNNLRVRYWVKNKRSLWVLEEIGKSKPITVGIIIENNKIKKLKVLVFRETRGWEVRHPFFINQFTNITLDDNKKLTQTIDGISGATLSVRALTKLARISLLLNQEIQENDTTR